MHRKTIVLVTISFVCGACAQSVRSTPGASVPADSVRQTAPAPEQPIPDLRNPKPASDTGFPTSPATPAGTVAAGRADTNASARAADSVHLATLERQARAIARETGCISDDQCRNAPVGIKACGGPRYYLKYCAASTDTAALFAKLAELAAAERAYNKRYHIVSDCMMMMATRPHLEGGSCR